MIEEHRELMERLITHVAASPVGDPKIPITGTLPVTRSAFVPLSETERFDTDRSARASLAHLLYAYVVTLPQDLDEQRHRALYTLAALLHPTTGTSALDALPPRRIQLDANIEALVALPHAKTSVAWRNTSEIVESMRRHYAGDTLDPRYVYAFAIAFDAAHQKTPRELLELAQYRYMQRCDPGRT